MSEKSILLGLDGSAQSRYAAELAWSMAKTGKMRVDAQHVVDSLAAWDFLAFDIAGFIGSGPYFEAHETMRNTLNSIGQNLIDVYRASAKQNDIEGEAFLDDGATIREICWRARDHEFVVLGHTSTGMESPDEDKRKIPRRSVAETLTHYCPKPLLVVQDRAKLWSKVRILLGGYEMPTSLISSCVDFAHSLKMEPTVRYLYVVEGAGISDIDKTSPDGLRVANDITQSIPGLVGKKVDVRSTRDANEYLRGDAVEEQDTLLIVPVTELAGVRKTAFGLTPDVMVRYLNHPAVLFWMYGPESETAPQASKSVSTAV